MKRSDINRVFQQAKMFFEENGWYLPPNPRWDISDFGLGIFWEQGLTLINLAEEPEYCEKLMYAVKNQRTPKHMHRKKKEDIICRNGRLAVKIWANQGRESGIQVNGEKRSFQSGKTIVLSAGERITLTPGIYHEFWSESEACIIGEISTANDDVHDNVFENPDIGRFSGIEEDEPAKVQLLNE